MSKVKEPEQINNRVLIESPFNRGMRHLKNILNEVDKYTDDYTDILIFVNERGCLEKVYGRMKEKTAP